MIIDIVYQRVGVCQRGGGEGSPESYDEIIIIFTDFCEILQRS